MQERSAQNVRASSIERKSTDRQFHYMAQDKKYASAGLAAYRGQHLLSGARRWGASTPRRINQERAGNPTSPSRPTDCVFFTFAWRTAQLGGQCIFRARQRPNPHQPLPGSCFGFLSNFLRAAIAKCHIFVKVIVRSLYLHYIYKSSKIPQ